MANELNAQIGITGLTGVTFSLLQAGAVFQSGIATAEIGSSGTYSGSMTGIASGEYEAVPVWNGIYLPGGHISWNGTTEATDNNTNVTYVRGTQSQGAAGYFGTDQSAIANPTATVALTGTTISTSQTVTTVTGNINGNVAGSVASVTATVNASLVSILGTALTESVAGYLTAAFKKFFNVASPTSTMNEITLVDTTTNLTNASGGDTPGTTTLLTRITQAVLFDGNGFVKGDVEDWKAATAPAMTGDAFARIGSAGAGLTALGDARIANLDAAVSTRSTYAGGAIASVTGAVGSVTGAVGSVTGNVGGNVTGSVGSVTGAVGSVTGSVGSVVATVNASLVSILGTALTESVAGYLAAAFKKFFNVASPTSTMNEITLVDTTTNLTNGGGGGGVTGANTITITIVDGSAVPIQFAKVSTLSGSTLKDTKLTDSNGQMSTLLDNGTYAVHITMDGYQPSIQTLVVSGNATPTYTLTALSINPSVPPMYTGYLVVEDTSNNPLAGVPVSVKLTIVASGSTGLGLTGSVETQISNSSGLVQFGHYSGATYQVSVNNGPWQTYLGQSSTFAIPSAIGNF